MKINTLNRYGAPTKPGILTSLLLATALTLPPGQTRAFPAESVDPAIHLPPDQAAQVTTEFLARNFANAFDLALNSPGDTLTLKIEGEVEFPIPIPDVPPGLFNGGIQLALTPEIKVVEDQENSETVLRSRIRTGQGDQLRHIASRHAKRHRRLRKRHRLIQHPRSLPLQQPLRCRQGHDGLYVAAGPVAEDEAGSRAPASTSVRSPISRGRFDPIWLISQALISRSAGTTP